MLSRALISGIKLRGSTNRAQSRFYVTHTGNDTQAPDFKWVKAYAGTAVLITGASWGLSDDLPFGIAMGFGLFWPVFCVCGLGVLERQHVKQAWTSAKKLVHLE